MATSSARSSAVKKARPAPSGAAADTESQIPDDEKQNADKNNGGSSVDDTGNSGSDPSVDGAGGGGTSSAEEDTPHRLNNCRETTYICSINRQRIHYE